MRKRIIITSRLLGDGIKRLPADLDIVYHADEPMTMEQLEAAIPGTWGLLSMTRLRLDKRVIDLAPDLKIIANYGVGYDNVDVEYAKRKGIVVTNTPDVLTGATADMAMALLLATNRRVGEGDRMVREGRFTGWKIDMLLGHDMSSMTLGIFGCGRIGQAVARRAAGFGMNVIYHNRTQLDRDIEKQYNLTYVTFDEMVERSDAVVITAPLNDATRHTFTLDVFKRMKPTAILVNAGRGPIVREADLVESLQKRLIRGAGLDVYEFGTTMSPGLTDLDSVTLAPHLGSSTVEARQGMCDSAIDAIVDMYEGRSPRHVVG